MSDNYQDIWKHAPYVLVYYMAPRSWESVKRLKMWIRRYLTLSVEVHHVI